jgi:putative transposase
MSNYRRAYVAGGSFFFTLVTERRVPIFRSKIACDCLGTALRDCQKRWSFRLDALVLLDDHLHAMWTLPDGDTDYSMRWGFIKKEFIKAWLLADGIEQPRSKSRVQQRRRGLWQRRFWEHALRDENDYARHFDYLHYNPVKHGYRVGYAVRTVFIITCPVLMYAQRTLHLFMNYNISHGYFHYGFANISH